MDDESNGKPGQNPFSLKKDSIEKDGFTYSKSDQSKSKNSSNLGFEGNRIPSFNIPE